MYVALKSIYVGNCLKGYVATNVPMYNNMIIMMKTVRVACKFNILYVRTYITIK